MSLNPQLLLIRKDPETIRKTVLTNILKMIIERKLLNNDKLNFYMEKFKTQTDDNTYAIDLDNPVKSDFDDKEYNKNFNSKKIMVRLIPQKIVGVNKSPVIKEFIDSYRMTHKILVFDGISEKAKHSILSTPNTEVFIEPFFMINLLEHIDSPRYEILNDNEVKELIESYNTKKNQLMKILTTDPVSAYFNLKRGQVLRIIRNSEQTINTVAYRIVAKGN